MGALLSLGVPQAQMVERFGESALLHQAPSQVAVRFGKDRQHRRREPVTVSRFFQATQVLEEIAAVQGGRGIVRLERTRPADHVLDG